MCNTLKLGVEYFVSSEKINCFGLVVMLGDSCSKGREFKSRHSILYGYYFTFICYKNCNVCFKGRK